jgi:hypothetical protein
LYVTDLEVISEIVSEDGSRRNQLVVHFGGQDYAIDKVRISSRKLVLGSDAPSTPGLREYTVTEEKIIPPTSKTIKRLAADITDSLMGDLG